MLAWRVDEGGEGEREGEPVVVDELKCRPHRDLDDERHRGPMLGLRLFFCSCRRRIFLLGGVRRAFTSGAITLVRMGPAEETGH